MSKQISENVTILFHVNETCDDNNMCIKVVLSQINIFCAGFLCVYFVKTILEKCIKYLLINW